MKKRYLFSAIMPLALIACNQENDLSLQEGTTINESAQEVDYFSDPNSPLLQNNQGNNLPIASAPSPASAPVSSNSNVQLNPEHGMPGHRCEIPVGAPLNSPATQQPTPTPINNTVQLKPQATPPAAAPAEPIKIQESSAPPALSQSGKVKLNPEHGQPGHKCEIPVGSPLPD